MFSQPGEDGQHQFHLTDRELLCKNRCGFYGTPQCKGFCSQCWRTYQLESKRISDYQNNIKVLRQQQEPPTLNNRKSSSDARFNIKTLLKKSPSVFSNSSFAQTDSQLSTSTPRTRAPSPDSLKAQEHFCEFLESTFPPTFAKELDKQCQNFVENLLKNELLPSEELSTSVQTFYQTMKDRVLKNSSTLPESFRIVDFITEIETFVCVRAYHILFGSRTEEEAEDLSLQTRIRSLHWVTNGFLETTLDESSSQVQECLNEAITEIVDLNSHRSVTGKLDCLVRCSKDIFDALRDSRSGAPASADEFLPVLILIILRANPPLIQTNLKFISRFGLPSRHMRGEYGYYFTNLSSAIYFIQDMNAKSLQISEEEFEGYTSGRRVAPSRNLISTSVERSFDNSLKNLDSLLRTQNELNQRADELESRINRDSVAFKERVRVFMEEDDGISEEIKLLCRVEQPNEDSAAMSVPSTDEQ